ncbi:Hsp20/alpha crystallin family protein [Paenibacillus chartarius]|uniref:Hsp20/alpha crystallin family protein n=1 Tax=Paenibacillus chartarius TaxID=747481 RepID=A0ABV6DG45_9BACL
MSENGGSGKGKGVRQGTGAGIWDQIEKFIEGKLSFMNPGGPAAAQFLQQPEWVQDIVRQALLRTLPDGGGKRKTVHAEANTKPERKQHALSPEVFETHRSVIARVKLPPKENPRALQVLVRSDRIKLLGLAGGEPVFIALPAAVVAKSARARCREGVLEICARKRKKGMYYEAYVE